MDSCNTPESSQHTDMQSTTTSSHSSKESQSLHPNHSDYENIQFLTKGSNALVFSATYKEEKKVAIKILKKDCVTVGQVEMENEYRILRALDHPHIIKCSGTGNVPRPFIEVEYLEGGTLESYLKQMTKFRKLSGPEYRKILISALSIARDLAMAMDYLHSTFSDKATIIHRGIFTPCSSFKKFYSYYFFFLQISNPPILVSMNLVT